MEIRNYIRPLVHKLRAVASESRIVSNDVLRVARGSVEFLKSGSTPEAAYFGLINLHCHTRGMSNDVIHALVRLARARESFPSSSGALGDLGPGELRHFTEGMGRDGFYVFPALLSPILCDALTDFARRTPARLYPPPEGGPKMAPYDRARPLAPNYRLTEQAILGCAAAEDLAVDLSVLTAAQAYLGCSPVLNSTAMWWSAVLSRTADSDAGQLFHFDMDRIKWLKFFFYLTDVTGNTGPHCFIAGSHRRFGQPRELLLRGYQRISDEEIGRYYDGSAFREIVGPRGTVVAVDTRGFHKGKVPTHGDRLLFQLEFTDSLFGASFERTPWHVSRRSIAERVERYPRIYQKFTLVGV